MPQAPASRSERLLTAASGLAGAALLATAAARTVRALSPEVAPPAGVAAWPVAWIGLAALALLAALAAVRLRAGRLSARAEPPAAPVGGDGEGGFWALVAAAAVAGVVGVYGAALPAPFDAESSLYRFDTEVRREAGPLSGPTDRMLQFGHGLFPENAALWRRVGGLAGDNPAALRATVLGALMLTAAALAAAARALGLPNRAALLAAAFFALHPYHALAAVSPAYGFARVPALLLAAVFLWRAPRGRAPGAVAGPMTTAAVLAALLWLHPRLWLLGLIPAWLEALDPREGEKQARKLYRAAPCLLLAALAAVLAPPQLVGPGVADPTPVRTWLSALPRLAEFTAVPVLNLEPAALAASLAEGAPNFLLGRALPAALAWGALLALASLSVLVRSAALPSAALGTIALAALALAAPGGASGLSQWETARDPRLILLTVPFALALGAALAPSGGSRALQAAAWALTLAAAAGLGLLGARSRAPLVDVAEAHYRFVNEFDRIHRLDFSADATFVFLGADTHDRGVLLADPVTLRAEMGRRREPASAAAVVMVDNEDPFVAGRRQITAEAWGEKAFVLRWDPAMLVQEDVTAEFLRRRAEGRDHPPPPVIWEAVGLETEWAPFGGRVSNEVGTPLEITGEGLVGLASKELNLQPQGYDFFEVKWKGDWVEPERPAGTLPAQFEWATYGAERVFMIPLTFEVSGDWGVARIPVSRSLSWLLAGNVRRMTIRVDSDRPVRVSVERIAIRRASRDGMIYIPPGKFTMGSDLDDYNRYELEPAAHEVFVRGFWIDRYEYPNEEGVVPRIDVDWYEAQALCDALGKRLCREAEWEKACKGPKMLRYPYGDDYDKTMCWTDQEFDGNFPKPAGTFPDCVSGYGVYDMAGNVSEWTSDLWTRDEVRAVKGLASYGTMDNWDQLPVPEIPLLKGGDWGEASEDTRCAGHNHYHLPNATYRDDGLRCCMDAE